MCGRYVEWGIPHLKATAVLGLLGGVEVLEGLAQIIFYCGRFGSGLINLFFIIIIINVKNFPHE
jgi:hypothetical protein